MNRVALYLIARFYEARAVRAMRVWAHCKGQSAKFSAYLKEFVHDET